MTVVIAAEPCAACKKRQARRPQGYLAHAEWAERMMKRYHQEQCMTCGYWTIWRRGVSNQDRDPASSEPEPS